MHTQSKNTPAAVPNQNRDRHTALHSRFEHKQLKTPSHDQSTDPNRMQYNRGKIFSLNRSRTEQKNPQTQI
ncbi:hypothetical protein LguiB_035170 [Lonicera macranthoides]